MEDSVTGDSASEGSGECTDTPTTMIDTFLMDERRRMMLKMIMINRSEIRTLFGITFANQWGHFTDHWMSRIVYEYFYWVDYKKGNFALKPNGDSSGCVVISNDGYFAFTASIDKDIRVYDLTTNQQISKWNAHDDPVLCLSFHHSLGLISGSVDCTLRIWNPFDYALIRTLKGHTDAVSGVNVNQKGTLIVSGSKDQSVRVWCAKTGECLRISTGYHKRVYSVLIQGESTVISGSSANCIRVLNVRKKSESKSVSLNEDGAVYSLSLNSDSSLLASVIGSGFIVYSWPGMDLIFKHPLDSVCCSFHPTLPDILAVDGETLSNEWGRYQDWSIYIFNVRTQECVRSLFGHSGSVSDLCFTPDGYRLLAVCFNGTAWIWDVSDLFSSQITLDV